MAPRGENSKRIRVNLSQVRTFRPARCIFLDPFERALRRSGLHIGRIVYYKGRRAVVVAYNSLTQKVILRQCDRHIALPVDDWKDLDYNGK